MQLNDNYNQKGIIVNIIRDDYQSLIVLLWNLNCSWISESLLKRALFFRLQHGLSALIKKDCQIITIN